MATESTDQHPKPVYIEFFLTDGSLAPGGISFNLVPRRPTDEPVRRFRRLGSLSVSA